MKDYKDLNRTLNINIILKVRFRSLWYSGTSRGNDVFKNLDKMTKNNENIGDYRCIMTNKGCFYNLMI